MIYVYSSIDPSNVSYRKLLMQNIDHGNVF